MKKWSLFIVLMVVLPLLACELPGSSEIALTPTLEPRVVESTPTATEEVGLEPTEVISTIEPTIDPTTEPTEEFTQASPVVFVDRTTDPPELVWIDHLLGEEYLRIAAPDMGYAGIGAVTETSVFYVDEDFTQVYRLLLDGTRQSLDFLNPDGGVLDGVLLPSPDGLRIAHGVVRNFDPEGDHVQLIVSNVDGSEFIVLVDETHSDRLTRPTPIKWSTDGDYLYYMNVLVAVGGYGGADLFKVEITTGERVEIFPDRNCLCSTSVSPDETRAVRALTNHPLSLEIRDLSTGVMETIEFPPDFLEVWEMVWAPDSSELLVTLGTGDWEEDAYSIARVNIDSLEVLFIISDNDALLRPMAWHVMETIWLNDSEGGLYHMDATSLEMTLVKSNARIIQRSD